MKAESSEYILLSLSSRVKENGKFLIHITRSKRSYMWTLLALHYLWNVSRGNFICVHCIVNGLLSFKYHMHHFNFVFRRVSLFHLISLLKEWNYFVFCPDPFTVVSNNLSLKKIQLFCQIYLFLWCWLYLSWLIPNTMINHSTWYTNTCDVDFVLVYLSHLDWLWSWRYRCHYQKRSTWLIWYITV